MGPVPPTFLILREMQDERCKSRGAIDITPRYHFWAFYITSAYIAGLYVEPPLDYELTIPGVEQASSSRGPSLTPYEHSRYGKRYARSTAGAVTSLWHSSGFSHSQPWVRSWSSFFGLL